MNEDNNNPELDERWQSYLKRRRRGKYIMIAGVLIIIGSFLLAIIPASVAAFSGTVYVGTPWEDYLGVAFIFGIVFVFAGLISRISPNMMEGIVITSLGSKE